MLSDSVAVKDSSAWLETNDSSTQLFIIVSSNQKPVHVLSLPQKNNIL